MYLQCATALALCCFIASEDSDVSYMYGCNIGFFKGNIFVSNSNRVVTVVSRVSALAQNCVIF